MIKAFRRSTQNKTNNMTIVDKLAIKLPFAKGRFFESPRASPSDIHKSSLGVGQFYR
jgi:hypothetical protein